MTAIVKETEERKLILLFAIHLLKTFDENEITERFRQLTDGKVSVGLGETIPRILRELVDIGALKYEDYQYSVREPASSVVAYDRDMLETELKIMISTHNTVSGKET